MATQTEENYLKAIYHLSASNNGMVYTNDIAGSLCTTAASVTDMLRKLSDKSLLKYERYKGVRITRKGEKIALNIIRKHRLWEVFLTEYLNFKWDEVHTMAEELEHVSSDELIERLDKLLNHPKFDPHGDPIPDVNGKVAEQKFIVLSLLAEQQTGIIAGVAEHSPDFLQYLEKTGFQLGVQFKIIAIHKFDRSMDVQLGKKHVHISFDIAKNILTRNQHDKK